MSDKLLHSLAYGVSAVLLYWGFRVFGITRFVWVRSVVGAVVLGFATECLQLLVPERSFQCGDLLADGLGAVVGALVAWRVVRENGRS